jgi:tRNA (adenine37-N6)-methyltransferase
MNNDLFDIELCLSMMAFEQKKGKKSIVNKSKYRRIITWTLNLIHILNKEKMEEIIINPIGNIITPFREIKNMPIQPIAAEGIKGYIEVYPEYLKGLKDIAGFSHLILLYHFHLVTEYQLSVVPFMDDIAHGIFATRAPTRPNRIGISIVKLIKIENNLLCIEGVDMLNGTPLIDIKPFYPKYDNRTNVKSGWLESKGDIPVTSMTSDERFVS